MRPATLDDALIGAGLMGGMANVIMQLSRPGVGHGVVESTVDSGNLFLHPVKRTRTTLTYLLVAASGTDEEKRQFRRAVNRVHARVHSTPTSPVAYDALDPDLQLWVAACLYRGFEDAYEIFVGPVPDDFYAGSVSLGATLQVPPERWPANRAAFEAYWTDALEHVHVDPVVRRHLLDLMRLRFLPWPTSVLFGPLHQWLTTGFLAPRFREELGLRWSSQEQRWFDRMVTTTAAVVRRMPRPLQRFPYNLVSWDLRRRIRTGAPLV